MDCGKDWAIVESTLVPEKANGFPGHCGSNAGVTGDCELIVCAGNEGKVGVLPIKSSGWPDR